MNVHQLRIFHTVARLGSFSRAAEELRISQPSVSIQVGDLERALGVELFEQLGRRTYLTEAGRLLFDYATRILRLLEEAETAMADVQGLRRGRLAVGSSTTPGTYVLPPILGEFKRRLPYVHVTMEIANTRRIQERVARNELDLGIVGWDMHTSDLIVQPFLQDRIVLIVPRGHRFAGARVSLGEVMGEPVIMRERGSGTREAIEAAITARGVTLRPVMELGSTEAIREAVAAGLGVAFISRYAIVPEAVGRLATAEVEEVEIVRPLHIVRHRDKRLSRAASAFLDLLLAAGESVA